MVYLRPGQVREGRHNCPLLPLCCDPHQVCLSNINWGIKSLSSTNATTAEHIMVSCNSIYLQENIITNITSDNSELRSNMCGSNSITAEMAFVLLSELNASIMANFWQSKTDMQQITFFRNAYDWLKVTHATKHTMSHWVRVTFYQYSWTFVCNFVWG